MKKRVRIILLEEADREYKKLNELVGLANTERKEKYRRDAIIKINKTKKRSY